MTENYYILIATFLAMAVAQILKPILYYIGFKKWDNTLLTASGGLPSSHSSVVVSLLIAVGLKEGFETTLFYISFVLACVVMYDAANVRYYAGRNIQLTRKLIDDLKKSDLYIKKLTDPIYDEKIKQILGPKWFEVFCGAVLGGVISWGVWVIIS